MRGRRGTGTLSYRPKKQLQKLMVSQINEQSGPIQPRKRNLKQWLEKERMKSVIFIDFHKKNVTEWMKKNQKKLFQAMSKFIKTKTPQQCQTFLNQIKQRILSYDNWISQQKELMTPELYGQKKNKYLQELCKIKVDNEVYTDEQIMAHKAQSLQVQQSSRFKSDQNQVINEKFTDRKLPEYIGLRIPGPNLSEIYQNINNKNNQFGGSLQSPSLIKSALPNNPQRRGLRFSNKESQRKKQIINKCQYHWKQWLRCAQLLEILSQINKQQTVKEEFIDIES